MGAIGTVIEGIGRNLVGILIHEVEDAVSGFVTRHWIAIDPTSPDGAGVQHVVTTTPTTAVGGVAADVSPSVNLSL